MLLNIFKINSYLAYVYLLLFTLFLGVFAVNFSFNASVFSDSVLYYFFQSTQIGILLKAGSIILLLANVLVFDLLLNSQEITEKNNHVPPFLLGIFLCYAISQNPLHPILFAQLLISASMWRFASIYKSNQAFSAIFDGAFALSTATVLYPPYCIFIPICFICLLTLRSFSLREWVLTLTGLVIPYLFYFALLFLFNKSLPQVIFNVTNSFHRAGIPAYLKGSFLINFIVISLSIFSMLFFLLKTVSNKIKTQKAFVIFLWMFILSIPTWFIVNTGAAFSALLSAMPLSIFCGIYLGNTKSRILAELLLWSFLSLFVISMLQQASVIN